MEVLYGINYSQTKCGFRGGFLNGDIRYWAWVLTQTATFTNTLLASFGFVILLSILLDIGAQLNIWRIVIVSGKRAQDISNAVFPKAGYFLAALIVMGGLAFNIGNVGGAGLGLNSILV